jgi:hypothetical protein
MADTTATKTPAIWLVAGSALIAAIVAPFIAHISAFPPNMSQGAQPTYAYSYNDPVLITFLFGAPIAALVAASVAYAGLAARRPKPFAVAAIISGIGAAYLVGGQARAIAGWWLGLSHDTNQVAATVAAVVSLISVLSVALSARFPVLRAAPSRRGAVAALLGISVLSGLFIGLFVGGEVATVTALQYGCATYTGSCYGPNIESALRGGAAVGMWSGGAMGLVAGAIVWALPPWFRRAALSAGSAPTG